MADPAAAAPDGLVVEGQRFAIVPEWVIDADIGDCAFRLYAVLLRYGQSSGARMPSRSTLARRLRKKSVDTVDRAMKELVALGAASVERRRDGKHNLTNLYHLRTSDPGRTAAATPAPGRIPAAGTGRTPAATPGRNAAAPVAAPVRHDPEHLTQEQPPPPDFDALAAACAAVRVAQGSSAGLWTARTLRGAYARAVAERGWPAAAFWRACLHVAADPVTRTPSRVAEAGPWWEVRGAREPGSTPDEALLEARLDALDGGRVVLQRRARAALQAEGLPLTRATVVQRAVQILEAG